MGCTSSKPKRTTSIEDVGAASKQPQPAPDKNGQVTKTVEKPLLREKDPKSDAIEIPGAHKSFMAPDGIPFIDEDVESELDEVTTQAAPVVSANDSRNSVKHGGGGGSSPDQNKNVAIVVNKEVKVVTAAPASSAAAAPPPSTKSSALKENAPLPPIRDESSTRREADAVVVVNSGEPVVISDIKIKEVQITTTKNQETGDSSETSDRRTLTDNKAKTDEELAATKIQAGIRGYLDRQKVKAIRGNIQHHPTEGEDGDHKDSTQEHAGPKVTEHVVVETTEFTVDEPHDPKLDAAATKIQANYKGYKTRKVIKTTTTTTTHSN
jgi:hypothetical protein